MIRVAITVEIVSIFYKSGTLREFSCFSKVYSIKMKYPDSVLIWIHIFTLCVAEETTKLEGDIIIGGLFKIFDLKDGACSNTVDTASVRDYEAVKWTLKKLNAANYIPGINIGKYLEQRAKKAIDSIIVLGSI